jgi:integrase/recombinase XerD
MSFSSRRQKGDPRTKGAHLSVEETKAARAAAARLGPRAAAFLEWLYTNGSRASEPGLALVNDVDLHLCEVRTYHLKGGNKPIALPMSDRCRQALEAWLRVRPEHIVDPQQKDYLFPSAHPRRCYPCRGKGELIRRKRGKDPTMGPCPHCRGTGTRFGFTRHEAYKLIRRICAEAGLPEKYAFPHIFRHSAATHLLDKGNSPTAIQERLGHASIETTLRYMHGTKQAHEAIRRTFDDDE